MSDYEFIPDPRGRGTYLDLKPGLDVERVHSDRLEVLVDFAADGSVIGIEFFEAVR